MIDAVRILERHPLPRSGARRFRSCPGLVTPADVAARVVVIEHADVGAPVVVDRVLPAAVEIPFEAAAVIADARVVQPADVRTPGAEVEAVGVREVEAALERGLLVGLREAAENVLAVDAEVAGDRVVRLGLGGCGLGAGAGAGFAPARCRQTLAVASIASENIRRSLACIDLSPWLNGELKAPWPFSTSHATPLVIYNNQYSYHCNWLSPAVATHLAIRPKIGATSSARRTALGRAQRCRAGNVIGLC